MMRCFNTEGECRPDVHYMVQLDGRLRQIKEQYIDRGKYFIINCGRQYGKTTTLKALTGYLKQEYFVLSMDFQMMSSANFENEQTFVGAFIRQLKKLLKDREDLLEALVVNTVVMEGSQKGITMDRLFDALSGLCEMSDKPVVLLIDEVDSASNNQVFIDFLAQLRGYYLRRDGMPTFHSVVLAGVYDVKNLKFKIRPETEHQYNSPWNIAADFDVDMSFPQDRSQECLRNMKRTGMWGWMWIRVS